MLPYIIAMILGFSCPKHTTTSTNTNGTATTSTASGDTGGETGHTPIKH